jgi:hypothetical protein
MNVLRKGNKTEQRKETYQLMDEKVYEKKKGNKNKTRK